MHYIFSRFEKKLIVFDFDKTLTFKDSFRFFFLSSFTGLTRIVFLVIYRTLQVLTILKIMSVLSLKKRCLWMMYRFGTSTEEKMIKYINRKVKLNPLTNRILNQVKLKNKCLIASASPIFYISKIYQDIEIIGMEYSSDNKILKHPYQEGKINALREKGVNKIDILFTDSYDDECVMAISKEVFLIKGERINKIK